MLDLRTLAIDLQRHVLDEVVPQLAAGGQPGRLQLSIQLGGYGAWRWLFPDGDPSPLLPLQANLCGLTLAAQFELVAVSQAQVGFGRNSAT